MHSEYTTTKTAATYVANPADPGSAVRKQAREATGRTPFSSVHPKQAIKSKFTGHSDGIVGVK